MSFRVCVKVKGLRAARLDGEEEDDFKTWALVTLEGGSHSLWYADDDNLGRTSVTNGFEAAYNYSRNSPQAPLNDDTIGSLASTTMTVTVYKGAARTQAEDTIIGSAAAPLLSLLAGVEVRGRFDLAPPPASPDGATSQYKASVDVVVTAEAVLEAYCRGCRLLTLSSLSVGTPPEAWAPAVEGVAEGETATPEQVQAALSASPHRYVLEVDLPAGSGPRDGPPADEAGAGGEGKEGEEAAEEDTPSPPPPTPTTVTLRVPGGVLQYAPAAATDSKLDDGGEEEEVKGDDEDTPTEAAPTPHHTYTVAFPAPATAYLSKTAVAQLVDALNSPTGVSATLKRVAVHPNDAGVEEYMDEDCLSRGAVTLLLDGLLAPGSATHYGEYNVTPGEVSEEEVAAAAALAAEREAKAAGGGKGGKKGGGKPPPKKGKGAAVEEEEEAPPTNVHEAAGAVLAATFSLDEPLVLRPPTPPAPLLKPEDLIPSRPAPLGAPPGVTASAEFREDAALVVHAIAEEYVKVCRELAEGGDRESRRRQLLASLNTSGAYHSMKERLKRSAVRIVRERFHKTDAHTDDDFQAAQDMFIGELYTYLVGQANRAMNAAFAEADATLAGRAPPPSAAASIKSGVVSLLTSTARSGAPPPTHTDSKDGESVPDRHARIAAEAEFEGDVGRAARAHQDRIAHCETQVAKGLATAYEAAPWHDYALFNIRQGNVPKATECLRECVAIEATRLPSLLLLGALHFQERDTERALAFLRGAVTQATASRDKASAALAHILLGLAAEAGGDVVASSAAIDAAVAAFKSSGASVLEATGDEEVDAVVAPSEAYLLAAGYLLDSHLTRGAEVALGRAAATLADQDVPRSLRVGLLVAEARLFAANGGGDLALADGRLDAALELDRGNKAAWAVRGRVALANGDDAGARTAIELAVGDWNAVGEAVDDALLMRLAGLYLAAGEGEDAALLASAKEVYLRAAKSSGWCIAWLGAGRAAALAGEATEAEAGLDEANIRDNHNPVVWAWLALVCMTAKPAARDVEGVRALDQALRLGLDAAANADVLLRLAEAFSADGKEAVAEKVLLRVVKATGDNEARLSLGHSLAAQRKEEAAVEHFKAVLDDAEDDLQRRMALKGAVDGLEALGRTQEAIALRARHV